MDMRVGHEVKLRCSLARTAFLLATDESSFLMWGAEGPGSGNQASLNVGLCKVDLDHQASVFACLSLPSFHEIRRDDLLIMATAHYFSMLADGDAATVTRSKVPSLTAYLPTEDYALTKGNRYR